MQSLGILCPESPKMTKVSPCLPHVLGIAQPHLIQRSTTSSVLDKSISGRNVTLYEDSDAKMNKISPSKFRRSEDCGKKALEVVCTPVL